MDPAIVQQIRALMAKTHEDFMRETQALSARLRMYGKPPANAVQEIESISGRVVGLASKISPPVLTGQVDLGTWVDAAVAISRDIAGIAKQLGDLTTLTTSSQRAGQLPSQVKAAIGMEDSSVGLLLMGAAAAFGVAWWLFRPGGFGAPQQKPSREDIYLDGSGRSGDVAPFDTDDEEDAEYEPA